MVSNRRQPIKFAYAALFLLLVTFHVSVAQNANERIVFMSDRDGNREIYTMNPDGTDVRRLTDDPEQDLQPTWSPDKTQIAFISNRDGHFAVYVMDPDGGNLQSLTTDEFAYYEYPSWSPDGKYIAYATDASGNFDISVVNVSTGEVRQITSNDDDETAPSWSPDGQRLVYLRVIDGAYEVFIVRSNGGGEQSLVEGNGGDFFSPRWSPDGSEVAYAITQFDTAGSVSEIYLLTVETGEEQLLTSRENSFIDGITWSQDGSELIFQSRSTQGNWALYRIEHNGDSASLISDQSANSENAFWYPPPLADRGPDFGSSGSCRPLDTIQIGEQLYLYEPTGVQVWVRSRPSESSRRGEYRHGTLVELMSDQPDRGYWLVQVLENPGNLSITEGWVRGYQLCSDIQESFCPDAPPSIVRLDAEVMVAPMRPANLRIRDSYGTDARQLDSLTANTRMTVIGGPECADGYTWWEVETVGGLVGWAAEGDAENNFMLFPAARRE